MLDKGAPASPLIRIEGVTRRFGPLVAVDNVSIDIAHGEFFALLGPSGCGKTTLMRMVAGLERPDAGRILIDGVDMSDVPAYRRPVNMMFQSYALFPHMSVARNIAFGLVQAGLPKAEIATRVADMLRLVQLDAYGDRKPAQLSGGQKQRVALARALARQPKLLLLDEPLAALDRKLREDTQFELMQVQRTLGTSFMVVTHDQDEAMVMASRMAVMKSGRIEQIGAPRDIYENPGSRWVAGFIGDINLFEGTIEGARNGQARLRLASGAHLDVVCNAPPASGAEACIAVRPECLRLVRGATNGAALRGVVHEIAYRGDTTIWRVSMSTGGVARIMQPNADATASQPAIGENVGLTFAPENGRLLTR